MKIPTKELSEKLIPIRLPDDEKAKIHVFYPKNEVIGYIEELTSIIKKLYAEKMSLEMRLACIYKNNPQVR